MSNHPADIEHAAMRAWCEARGLAFDDDGPIDVAAAAAYEAHKATGASHRCLHCGADIYVEPGVGWVDALSGDHGGTYDLCDENVIDGRTGENGGHKPAPLPDDPEDVYPEHGHLRGGDGSANAYFAASGLEGGVGL